MTMMTPIRLHPSTDRRTEQRRCGKRRVGSRRTSAAALAQVPRPNPAADPNPLVAHASQAWQAMLDRRATDRRCGERRRRDRRSSG